MDKEKIAYLAGLFDADGSITYKQYFRSHKKNSNKRYWTWYIRMELSMTNEDAVKYIYEVLTVGTIRKKPPHKTSLGKKMQYRWRCNHREALGVCKLFLPHAIVKLDKIKQIINHYKEDNE